jgi:ATP-dependent helicase HrpB
VTLPIHEALPALKSALAGREAAVLVAPPGAGKTTVVPLALLDEAWVEGGKIVMLEPRRLAARAAASRMAQSLGESVGETVGFRVRLQSKVSARTRIEVVTEGVFTRMILDDPGLDGVAAVIFDEFHERSLDADLGLALARDAQGLVREDLKILVMSATLDGARISALLGDAPVVESQGRMFPVDTRYLGRDERSAWRSAWSAPSSGPWPRRGQPAGLPAGPGRDPRTETLLRERLRRPEVDVAPLYGALDPAEQDRAVAPAAPGRRKVVLATSIAETSLTIEGVRVVIDCGLARVPRFDPSSGLTRLETVRVSRAAADQRRGRAGRTEPGVCYRLWDEPETRALPAFARPEILEADLSNLALTWPAGARGTWATWPSSTSRRPPPSTRRGSCSTPAGPGRAGRPDRPRPGPGRHAAGPAPGPHGGARRRVRPGRARRQDRRRAQRAGPGRPRRRPAPPAGKLRPRPLAEGPGRPDAVGALGPPGAAGRRPGAAPLDDALLLAEAYPERVARARGKPGEYQLAGGRGVYLEPTDALARETWLAVGELGGGEARDRILLAAPLDEAALREAFADRLVAEDRLEPDARGKVRARRLLRLGKLVVEERLLDKVDPGLVAKALLDQVTREGLSAVPLGEGAQALRRRVAFLRERDPETWPDLSDAALLDRLPNGWSRCWPAARP